MYTSATLSLAMLEMLVHAELTVLPDDQVAVPIELPPEIAHLLREWRRYPAPEAVRALGTAWTRAGRTAVLALPSAVVPQERNYLLNPRHPQFTALRIGRPQRVQFDARLGRR